MGIAPLDDVAGAIRPLREEAASHGLAFVQRLEDEWASGVNRFARCGECLLGAWSDDKLVGCAGLTVDPYTAAPATGRLRHVYVLAEYRRSGVGEALVSALVVRAVGHFTRLRLRAADGAAASFYEAVGFAAVDEPFATHVMAVTSPRDGRSGRVA